MCVEEESSHNSVDYQISVQQIVGGWLVVSHPLALNQRQPNEFEQMIGNAVSTVVTTAWLGNESAFRVHIWSLVAEGQVNTSTGVGLLMWQQKTFLNERISHSVIGAAPCQSWMAPGRHLSSTLMITQQDLPNDTTSQNTSKEGYIQRSIQSSGEQTRQETTFGQEEREE